MIAEAGECDTRQPRRGEASLLWCDGGAGTGPLPPPGHRVTNNYFAPKQQSTGRHVSDAINGFSNMLSPPVNGKHVHKSDP